MEILQDLINNRILVCAVIGWCVAQVLKTIIYMILNKEFVAERMVGSGGMPSSHSSTVCALATSCFIECGPASTQFALAAVFAIIVMYDAMGVRREAGKQAKLLNEMLIVFQDMGNKFKTPQEKLKEFVGHTPLQVVMGAILGVTLTIIIYLI